MNDELEGISNSMIQVLWIRKCLNGIGRDLIKTSQYLFGGSDENIEILVKTGGVSV
jgi:hypothetical protein